MQLIVNAYNSYILTTKAVSFDRFWQNSRFYSAIDGFDCTALVKQAFLQIYARGGSACFIECSTKDHVTGSLVVFNDPWYRSYKRDNVACFGLVTVSDSNTLETLLDAGMQEMASRGFSVLRGPVNVPRCLFGYGVQAAGYEWPVVAGSSFDPPLYKDFFTELAHHGFFTKKDRYFNLHQDFDKTQRYISMIDLDRGFRVRNPSFDNLGDLPGQIASMMNRTLEYRPDYMAACPESILAAVEMYKSVPGSERLLGLFYDGDTFAGAVLMQPDWFQVLAHQPVIHIIGDIYMLDSAFQGRRLFMNFSEYSMAVLAERGATYYEHASIWEKTEAITSSVKNGYANIIKEYWVIEKRL